MRYLVAHHRAGSTGKDWSPNGEAVVPNVPTGAQNTFLGVPSFKTVPYARVADCPTLNIDKLAADLKHEYPGLPASLWDAYVMETAKLASRLPVGTICQIFIDEDSAAVMPVDRQEIYTLWAEQPLPKGQA